jgi:hypothetical protein
MDSTCCFLCSKIQVIPPNSCDLKARNNHIRVQPCSHEYHIHNIVNIILIIVDSTVFGNQFAAQSTTVLIQVAIYN